MNKIFNRKGYNFKEDLKDALTTVFWIAVIVLTFYGAVALLDHIDQYKVGATVISVESFDEQIVTFETERGDIFVECFDYEYTIKPQTKAILTVKDFEDGNVKNDKVVNVKWVK